MSLTDDWRNGGFGIYVHWPFCEAKCPYCDFNSHVSRKVDQSAWKDAYLSELSRYADLVPDRVVNSVYFGGGTPSLMNPNTTASLLDQIAKTWSLANDIEITLEANPSSVEAERFADFKSAGINRVSMGVQALNDKDLKRLGRLHSANEAVYALETAANTFDRTSFDLIYARQDQSPKEWKSELEAALTLGFSHLSLYQLTIEPGTAFGDRYKLGMLKGLPDEDMSADMYAMTNDICRSHGLNRYEVSNHAIPGEESRHNLLYWNYGDYVGIGPGAHGRVTIAGTRYATETVRQPNQWLEAVKLGLSETVLDVLTNDEQASEMLLMGLRTIRGISIQRFESLRGGNIDQSALNSLLELGLVSVEKDRLTVLDQGFSLINAITGKLLTN